MRPPSDHNEDTKESATCKAVALNTDLYFSLATRPFHIVTEDYRVDQRETLVRTRRLGNTASWSVSRHEGSCLKLNREKVVTHLSLPNTLQPAPYGLQWLSSKSGNIVSPQCLLPFSIGPYKDTNVGAMFAMDAISLLLGRPWQSVRRVLPEGYLNTYVFTYQGRRVTFLPLSLSASLQEQVEHDQDHNVTTTTAASSSTRHYSNPGAASNTTDYNGSIAPPNTAFQGSWEHHVLLERPKEFSSRLISKVPCCLFLPTPSMLEEFLVVLRVSPPQALQSLRGTQQTFHWVPGAYLSNRGCRRFVFDTGDIAWEYLHMDESPSQKKHHVGPRGEKPFRVLHSIEDSAKHIELPRGHGVQVTYNVAFLHEFEELMFNKGEAGTLHSQVGEGDATLPSMKAIEEEALPLSSERHSRKTASFFARLASSTESAIFNVLLGSGSEIAISFNHLHPSQEIAFYIRLVAIFIERVPRVLQSAHSPSSTHAFYLKILSSI